MTASAVHDVAWWEEYFSPGGGWERNGGREQTRTFAQHFVAHAGLDPRADFSLLDVGCALGDALLCFSAAFPQARLHGIDFSPMAISRCRRELPSLASFAIGDIASVTGHYDVIYCSNTLEHFADFDAKARSLVVHCDRLFVMVPYLERIDGRPLTADPGQHHQHTFDERSFDFLIAEGLARKVDSQVLSCPGAWGWSSRQRLLQRGKNVVRKIVGRPQIEEPFQILYDIATRQPER